MGDRRWPCALRSTWVIGAAERRRASSTGRRPPPTRPPEKEANMADTISYISIYEQRVRLVAYALKQNSKLNEAEAVELAVHVLQAIDHVPEKVR